jgi:NAD(P)-dependent dehydrogenase (short-subunit alcohol dehydrogenase family)
MTGVLQDKVVVVSGAGGGIGRATATLLAREGAKVVVNDLGTSLGGDGSDESVAEAVAADLRAEGWEAVASTESVAEWNSARSIVDTALDTFGRLDGVVNNAGILRDGIFHKMSPEDWDAVIRVHLYGSFHLSRAAAEHFRAQGSGAFVHITSTSGLIGATGQANYAAAKMGIVGLSRAIALDMQRFGVRSNCVAPSAFTRMIESIPTGADAERAAWIEKRRTAARPEQVSPLIAFLLSDAAQDISGQIFGSRGNEIFLYNQTRPVRSLHHGDGWTPQLLTEQLLPAWGPSITALAASLDVMAWQAL